MSDLIYPKQTWRRRAGDGVVRIWLVDDQRIGFRCADEAIRYMPRARFLATFRRMESR